MFEDIQKHRQAVRENIEKSFQIGYTENEDFEKAHKVGDVHPNGKWVWTQLPSGKFDWRVIKKTNTPSKGLAPVTVQKTAQSGEKKGADKISKEEYLKKASKALGTYDGSSYYTSGQTPYGKMDIYARTYFGKREYSVHFINAEGVDVSRKINGAMVGNSGTAAKKAVLKYLEENYKEPETISEVKSSSKKNPSELKTISEVEDYAKGIDGVTFKNVESGWGDKRAKAFELTYPHGGKMIVDFLHNGEYVYELIDSKGNPVISTNSTDETALTDWSFRLNPDKIVSRSIEVLKTKLTKLKGEETKARNKMIRNYSSFSDKYAYQKASEAVSDMKTKIQKLQSLIGTF